MKCEKIVFTISNENDLKKLDLFKMTHMKSCWNQNHDVTGALLSYTVIPTGLGTIFKVKCECGEEIVLDGDIDI